MSTVSFINGDSLSAPELQSISQFVKTLSVVFLQCIVDSLARENKTLLHEKIRLVFNCQGTLVAWDGDHGENGHVLKYKG